MDYHNQRNVNIQFDLKKFHWFPKLILLMVLSILSFFGGLLLRGFFTLFGNAGPILVATELLIFGGLIGFLGSLIILMIGAFILYIRFQRFKQRAYDEYQNQKSQNATPVDYIEDKDSK